jgi:hypothetical protein
MSNLDVDIYGDKIHLNKNLKFQLKADNKIFHVRRRMANHNELKQKTQF